MQAQYEELTDAQWDLASFYIPERKRRQDLRAIFNAILWIVRTGCQWRNLDSKFPYWQIVYYYFRSWTKLGIFAEINMELVDLERLAQGKKVLPSANIIDSQSIKIAPMIPNDKGIDGGKKVNGRKRHILTDTLGLVMAVMVHSANIHDAKGGCLIFNRFLNTFKYNVKCFFADAAYGGLFKKLALTQGIDVIIASKPESSKGFIPIHKRWVVERTFGWFNFYRRLSKDYERCVENSESMILLAQIQILLNRNHFLPN